MKKMLTKRFLLRGSLLGVILSVAANPLYGRDLFGVWVIDVEKTEEFIDSYPRVGTSLDDRRRAREQRACFETKLKITEQNFIEIQPYKKCLIDGKEIEIYPMQTEISYRIIGESGGQIVLQDLTEKKPLSILNFVDGDHFWVYYGGQPPHFNEHVRTYYKREN